MREQRRSVALGADETLLGNNYLQLVFLLRADSLRCLRICGCVMQKHNVLGCTASVRWLMFFSNREEAESHMNADALTLKMKSSHFWRLFRRIFKKNFRLCLQPLQGTDGSLYVLNLQLSKVYKAPSLFGSPRMTHQPWANPLADDWNRQLWKKV